jgi:membrane fusion protein, heavy metal efflux system
MAPHIDGESIQFPTGSPQLKSLQVEAATSEALTPLRLSGRLSWNEDRIARVLPPVAGRIMGVPIALGARVGTGALLAELSSPDFGQAQADAQRAEADLHASERSHERIARLYERGAAPRKDLEAAETDVSRLRAERERTATRLRRWGGDPSSPLNQLYRITSPLAGTVVERTANVGQEVRPDAPVSLFVVTDPSRLWVMLDVTERDLAVVRRGDRLAISSSAYPDRSFPGRLDLVGDALDPATRTVKARGLVENPGSLLKAEMYVSVQVEPTGNAPVTTVPVRSVLTDGERRFCFIETRPRRFERVNVIVGVERNGRVSIASGLPANARVVTNGSLLLLSLLAPGEGS